MIPWRQGNLEEEEAPRRASRVFRFDPALPPHVGHVLKFRKHLKERCQGAGDTRGEPKIGVNYT